MTAGTPRGHAWRQWLRGWRVAVVGALATVLVIAIAVSLSSQDDPPGYLPDDSSAPFASADRPKPSDIAREAEAKLEQGQPDAAIAFLVAKGAEIRDDPYAQLLLGHAYAAVQGKLDAARAYQRAVKLAPGLGGDSTLRTNLGFMLDDKKKEVVVAALGVLEVVIQATGDKSAKKELVEIATSHERIDTRHRALVLVEKLGLEDRIDRLAAYTLDLEQGKSCKDRRKAVGKLRALGNKRAIPALTKARKRIRKGGILGLENKNTNYCLKKDADEAIEYLESR